ncbi:hypothetical protein VQ042_10440 [Aurantimonas sp. A2-1-M11]|uniref:hypothetical protein n=1 Tax=Aurantimonas sp. A2-1-M11 TaxID=3113712 RepID=UPI002F933473
MAVILKLNSRIDRHQRAKPSAPCVTGSAEIVLLPCVRREPLPDLAKGGTVLKRQA